MKQATLDLIKNIDENTFIPPSTKNELFELFQLDTVADLRKVSRNFMKLYEILEHLDGQTSSATDTTAGIVKFGTETGNAIDAETWKQAIGQSLGGYVSKVENKEAGKWYINDLTDGKIYKCIQTHTSTSFDITKFVDITNVGLSDKLENLSEIETKIIEKGIALFKVGNIVILTWDSNYNLQGSLPRGAVLANLPVGYHPLLDVSAPVAFWNSNNSGTIKIRNNGQITWESSINLQGTIYVNASFLTS